LQERLHELLSRIATVSDIVKNWPESDGDVTATHVERTSRLIAAIRQVLTMIEKTETVVKADAALKQSLQDCLIPLDLLDLMDHGGGLNPDCFSRGILTEALGQLAGLTRRKLALSMLGAAVQQGINQRQAAVVLEQEEAGVKRERDDNGADDGGGVELPTKRVKTEGGATAIKTLI
jgi:hypothetical protein